MRHRWAAQPLTDFGDGRPVERRAVRSGGAMERQPPGRHRCRVRVPGGRDRLGVVASASRRRRRVARRVGAVRSDVDDRGDPDRADHDAAADAVDDGRCRRPPRRRCRRRLPPTTPSRPRLRRRRLRPRPDAPPPTAAPAPTTTRRADHDGAPTTTVSPGSVDLGVPGHPITAAAVRRRLHHGARLGDRRPGDRRQHGGGARSVLGLALPAHRRHLLVAHAVVQRSADLRRVPRPVRHRSSRRAPPARRARTTPTCAASATTSRRATRVDCD